MDEYPCWGSLSFHGLVPHGSQSRHLGRVGPDPFPSHQQGTDRAPFLMRKNIYFRKLIFWLEEAFSTQRMF